MSRDQYLEISLRCHGYLETTFDKWKIAPIGHCKYNRYNRYNQYNLIHEGTWSKTRNKAWADDLLHLLLFHLEMDGG